MRTRSFPLLALAAPLAAAPAPAQTLDEALEVFYRNEIHASLPLFEHLAAVNPADPDLRVWLGDVHLRMDNQREAMEMARAALAMRPCHGAAHNLLASAYTRHGYMEPGGLDSLWTHARRATECDPGDGNAWLGYWMAGTLRRDTAAEAHAQRRLAALGFIPEPVMERARWMLRDAPPGAVVVTNGDWDYFPMAVAQTVEGVRPDVALVQRSLLEFPWYVRWMSARTGLPMPRQVEGLSDDDWNPLVFADEPLPQETGGAWAAATLTGGPRPLVIAATADVEWIRPAAWPRLDGGVYTLHPPPDDPETAPPMDADAIAASLRRIDMARLDGPLVHPTDRSPVRRTDRHPADFMVFIAAYWAIGRQNEGDAEGAREALAWVDRVIATGRVAEDRLAWWNDVRREIEAAQAAEP